MKKCLPCQRVLRPIKNNKGAGFSLIELTIVCLLLALIMRLAITLGATIDHLVVRAEVEQLYTLCYVLQRRAMMEGRTHTIIFDVAHNSYIDGVQEYRLPSAVRFGTAPQVKGPPSSPDALITYPVTFKNNAISMTPDGIMQPGAVYITDRNHSITYAISCAVAHVSYLRKYQYTKSWCVL